MREHGTHWFSGACFNCSCADGLVSCVKYHVTVQYGLFRIETVGNCMPYRRPSDDIFPTGSGTVSACQGWSEFAINLVFHMSLLATNDFQLVSIVGASSIADRLFTSQRISIYILHPLKLKKSLL